MRRLGVVLHCSGQRNLIVRVEGSKLPSVGSEIITRENKKLGSVVDIFGPVSRPYVAVKLRKKIDPLTLVGKRVYMR